MLQLMILNVKLKMGYYVPLGIMYPLFRALDNVLVDDTIAAKGEGRK